MNYHDIQQSYSQETFKQSTYSALSRKHNSARIKYVSPEGPSDSASVKKAGGVDRPFPIKPVYHKITLIIDRSNNYDASCKPNEFQRLPLQFSSPKYDGKIGLASHRKPADDPSSPSEDNPNERRVSRYQLSKEEKQRLDYECGMAKKIDVDKLKLQEKLLKTLGAMQQRGRAVSVDNTKGDRDIRRQLEREKEWNFSKVASTEQRRGMERDPEMERREALIHRAKKLEDIDWQRDKEERERREMRSLAKDSEKLGRMEREMVNKPKWSRDKRRTKLESEPNEERSWSARETVRDRDSNRERLNRKDADWVGVKRSENNRWEREKVKEEGQHREVIRKDIDWRSSRERDPSADDMRREHDISHRGLIQEGQLRNAHESVPESSKIHSRRLTREASHISPALHLQSSRLLQVDFNALESTDNSTLQLIPCRICLRKFAAERLQKHHEVCERTQQSSRKVFDSSRYRAKGTDLEEFMKTNSRSKSPVLKKSNWRQKHEAFIQNLRQSRVPAVGDMQPQPPIQVNDDYVTCPHCVRRFAPGPAERHIPKCQNIKSRPPPPRHRH